MHSTLHETLHCVIDMARTMTIGASHHYIVTEPIPWPLHWNIISHHIMNETLIKLITWEHNPTRFNLCTHALALHHKDSQSITVHNWFLMILVDFTWLEPHPTHHRPFRGLSNTLFISQAMTWPRPKTSCFPSIERTGTRWFGLGHLPVRCSWLWVGHGTRPGYGRWKPKTWPNKNIQKAFTIGMDRLSMTFPWRWWFRTIHGQATVRHTTVTNIQMT